MAIVRPGARGNSTYRSLVDTPATWVSRRMLGELPVAAKSARAASSTAQCASVSATRSASASAAARPRVHAAASTRVPSAVNATPSITAATWPGLLGTAQAGAGGAALTTGAAGSALGGAARSVPSTLRCRFGPRISASLAFLSSACCCLAAIALTPWPIRRSTSIITAMPRWTSSSLVARIIPNSPIGLAVSACWIASPASAATRITSGWVSVRTVSRIITTASPSCRTSAAEKFASTFWPTPPSSRTNASVPSRSSASRRPIAEPITTRSTGASSS